MRSILSGLELLWHELQVWDGGNLRDDERLALSTLLSGSDPRLVRLQLQWECARRFQRKSISSKGVEIRWRFTESCLGNPSLASGIESLEVPLKSTRTDIRYLCSVKVEGGGWCNSLRIRKITAAEYELVLAQLAESPPAAYLPFPEVSDQIAARDRLSRVFPGLSFSSGDFGLIELRDGVSADQLLSNEATLGRVFPEAYRAFSLATNGLVCGETEILDNNNAIRTAQAYNLPSAYNLYVACDVVNGLADGFWYIPLEDNPEGRLYHVDNYGRLDPERLRFEEFLQFATRRAFDQEKTIIGLQSKRRRNLSEKASSK